MISDETPRTAASALLAELEREDAALEAAMRPTVEEERAVMAATQQQAAEHGDSAKAGGEHGWVGSMLRKFERFLEKHGDTYGYDAKEGLDGGSQSLVLVRAFMDYCFSGLGREQTFSGVGRKGFADEYFSLHLPYALAQKVFYRDDRAQRGTGDSPKAPLDEVSQSCVYRARYRIGCWLFGFTQ